MSRQYLTALLGGLVIAALAGCKPQQPFYFFEDGDLSHYVDVATEMEHPDLQEPTSNEVDGTVRPFSLGNQEVNEVWDLRLEEAVQIALANNRIMRQIGGQVGFPPEFLLRNPQLSPTIYDPAIMESDPRAGTEAALSAFDAQFATSVFWERNDVPRNTIVVPGFQNAFPTFLSQDVGSFQAQLSKTAATGGTWTLRHNVAYDKQNSARLFGSDWNVNVEAEFRQPLLQGAGVQFNRIVGPNGQLGAFNGVVLARIRTDIALADFEEATRDLVGDVETAYWELYYAYRALDTLKAGYASGLQTWRQVNEKFKAGSAPVHEEAQARQQCFLFRSAMEKALTTLYQNEATLRYMLGLSTSDGRLIRPADEPTHAKVTFDWCEILAESLARQPELREQRWYVKQRELELIGAKNFLLPRLDAVGRYAWVGLGDDLISANPKDNIFNNAYESMTTSKFFQWHVGLEFSVPIGQRREMAGVRNAQLTLVRERARLQELELELTHQLANAVRQLDSSLVLTQTNFNRRVAARDEVRAAIAKYEAQVRDGTLTNVLDAQRRLAEAEGDYYRSLVDYNEAIMQVHFRKGSLLEYNGVYLAEGPWPAKAYFDANRRARARDAALYLDYGFTMPKVVSRGPINQQAGEGGIFPAEAQGEPTPAVPEAVPAPAPESLPPAPELPEPPAPVMEGAAGGVTGGPRLAPSNSWSAAPPRRKLDLGELNLAGLTRSLEPRPAATKLETAAAPPASWHGAARSAASVAAAEGAVRRESGVVPASYDAPAAAPPTSSIRWSNPAANADESLASPATAAPDRSAPGWKRLQH